jgi:hypothetical protein
MQLEHDCGIDKPALRSPSMEARYERLYALGEYLLNQVGKHYQKYYAAYAPEVASAGVIEAAAALKSASTASD